MQNNDFQSDAKPSGRNLIGTAILLLGLSVYAFIAAAIGNLIDQWWLPVQVTYYVLAGIIWIFPARRLFVWMAAGRSQSDQSNS